jgi:hypothetical protein
MKEYNRRLTERLKELNTGVRVPSRIERVLPSNRSGDLPELRRMSGENEPPRFGVIWGGGELLWRWLRRFLVSTLFFGLGAACLYAAWKARRV